jgi:hypothetical protein|tara:strand:- start:6747 stop:7295 length:549 start_codon:yes stop_codon:yes gene_type:complete
MINKTFSKGDLLEIISNFGIDIPNANNMDKLRLSIFLWSELGNLKEITADNEIYMIQNLQGLKDYLQKPNPDKILTVKQKQTIMRFCREVIVYCNNGYNIDCSIFKSREEIYIPMKDLSIHGDIPSVRRAILLLNKDVELKEKIKPIISNRMIKLLDKKKNKKVKTYYGLIHKSGNYTVVFH